jgi:hypothetical protein
MAKQSSSRKAKEKAIENNAKEEATEKANEKAIQKAKEKAREKRAKKKAVKKKAKEERSYRKARHRQHRETWYQKAECVNSRTLRPPAENPQDKTLSILSTLSILTPCGGEC